MKSYFYYVLDYTMLECTASPSLCILGLSWWTITEVGLQRGFIEAKMVAKVQWYRNADFPFPIAILMTQASWMLCTISVVTRLLADFIQSRVSLLSNWYGFERL